MVFMVETSASDLLNGLAKLKRSEKYSDLKIRCGLKEYAVHRAVICSRGDFFDSACSNPFIEAQSGVIDLSEDDEDAVERMINYFYYLDYEAQHSPAKRRRLSNRLSVSAIGKSTQTAQRSRRRSVNPKALAFEDPLLAQAAASAPPPNASFAVLDITSNAQSHKTKKNPEHVEAVHSEEYEDSVPEHAIPDTDDFDDAPHETPQHDPITHTTVYAVAEKYGIHGLKALARAKFLASIHQHIPYTTFSAAIAEVYESTVESDRGLRDIVVQIFREQPYLAQRTDVVGVLEEVEQLAWEVERVVSGLPVR